MIEEIERDSNDKFNNINKAFSYEILNAVKKALKQEKSAHFSVKLSGGTDSTELIQVLNSKATKADLERLNDTKSSKAES